MIIVESCAGLGNRMLGIASAYYWSVELGEKITVLWKEEEALGAPIGEIFTLPDNLDIIDVKDFGYKKAFFSQVRYEYIKKKYEKKADYFSDIGDTIDNYKSDGAVFFRGKFENNKLCYIRALSEFYDFGNIKAPFDIFKPSERVARRVEAAIGNEDMSEGIGVHIRRTDNKISIDNSPIELFVEAMKKEVQINDKVWFYVASDDQEVLDYLEKQFGSRIKYMRSKAFERNSTEGIVDAFAEMLCLSRTSKIYGTFYSTYSRAASMLTGTPLIVLKKGEE